MGVVAVLVGGSLEVCTGDACSLGSGICLVAGGSPPSSVRHLGVETCLAVGEVRTGDVGNLGFVLPMVAGCLIRNSVASMGDGRCLAATEV